MTGHLHTGQLVARPKMGRRPAAQAFVHLVQPDALGKATRVVLEYRPSGKRVTVSLRKACRWFPPC